MNPRHQILEDKKFWVKVEFGMLLQPEKKEKFPRYWIDGFIPEYVADTRKGIEIEGKVWIVDGDEQNECSFLAIVPQKLLYKKVREFEYVEIDFDPENLHLKFEIGPSKPKQNQALDSIGTSSAGPDRVS